MPLALLAAACTQQKTDVETVVFEKSDTVSPFSDAIKKIELVPLETADAFLLGGELELTPVESGYVVTDVPSSQILFFAPDGSFRNRIGMSGNGPAEYPDILNVQVDAQGEVVVFSNLEDILYFGLDGRLLRKERQEGLGLQSCLVPEGILSYYGYGSSRPERVVLHGADGARGFLKSDAHVLGITPDAPLFSSCGDTFYFTDAYDPTVYSYKDGEVSPVLDFDFGKYALGAHFFEFEDPFDAAVYMLAQPDGFMLIRRYMRDERHQFVETSLQKEPAIEAFYAFETDGRWQWFYPGPLDESPFAGSIKALRDGSLYCLLPADALTAEDNGMGGDLASLRALIVNPEALERISPDDNPVIAKIELK